MILFRPVGLNELRLIYDSGLRRFPPRLPEQPIFYPVLDEGYARQIARDWNTKSEAHAGFVTRFTIDDEYVQRFERKIVGGKEHEELWVPAEQLADFNDHIEGRIEIIDAFFGEGFRGSAGSSGEVIERFVELARSLDREDFAAIQAVINADPAAFFLDFPYWEQVDASERGIAPGARDDLLVALRRAWAAEGRAATPIGCRPPRTLADGSIRPSRYRPYPRAAFSIGSSSNPGTRTSTFAVAPSPCAGWMRLRSRLPRSVDLAYS